MARKLKPATPDQVSAVDRAAECLRQALAHLKAADCPRTLARVRAARRSLDGARRHVDRREWRTRDRAPLPVFEVTGAGFDGATDETDDRVLWIAAPSAADVLRAIADTGATFCGAIDVDADIDFTLPRQALALGEVLLKMASDERNARRA